MSRNISIYIKDILENMENVLNFTKNLSYEEFSHDKKINYAVVRCIEMNNQRAKARGILSKDNGNLPPLRSGQAFIPSLKRHGVFSQVFIKGVTKEKSDSR